MFTGVHLKLRHLDNWVRKTGTVVDIAHDDQSGGMRRIQVTTNLLEKEVVSSDVGELELIFTYKFNPNPFHTTTLTQSAVLGVQFNEPRTLEDTFEICNALRNLVTIGVDAPAFVTEASVTHSDFVRESLGGKVLPLRLGLYTRGLGDSIQSEVTNIHLRTMLFTFDDIGGLNGMAQWLKTSAKFRPVIDSLLSHWYLPSIYTENQFLNIIIAAEALERIRLDTQRFDFAKGLERLVAVAGDPFKALVQDVQLWVREIVRVRVNNLVHPGLRRDIEGARMLWLSESVYFLVVLCLLRECGVSEGTLSNMKRHQRFSLVAEQLRGVP